jgi:aryl-alcohol dehydrogenase-like predicted oxidoreductase
MIYRTLGSSGLKVSAVGIGTWQFGGEWGTTFTPGEVEQLFDAARQNGITLIDTAECYGDHLSERLVGRAIKKDRARWILATKFGHRFTVPFEREQLWSAEQVHTQLEDSLAALATDYIDLYQFHSGTNAVFENEALWSMLGRQKEAGKVRHLGISIASSIPAEDQARQAAKARELGAECLQVVYNRLQRQPEDAIFPTAVKDSLGVLARVPLASGFLTGKYHGDSAFEPGDIRSKKSAEEKQRLSDDAERFRREEVPEGGSMAAWALAWCLRNPAVTAVIPGCKSREQVAQNAGAADLLA